MQEGPKPETRVSFAFPLDPASAGNLHDADALASSASRGVALVQIARARSQEVTMRRGNGIAEGRSRIIARTLGADLGATECRPRPPQLRCEVERDG